jgi:hypothetical protein
MRSVVLMQITLVGLGEGCGRRCGLTLSGGFVIQVNSLDAPELPMRLCKSRPRPDGNPREQDGSEGVRPKWKAIPREGADSIMRIRVAA